MNNYYNTIIFYSVVFTASMFCLQSVVCATNGNIGCSGGDTCRVLEWMVTDNVGLVPEEQYPFHAITGTCQLKK